MSTKVHSVHYKQADGSAMIVSGYLNYVTGVITLPSNIQGNPELAPLLQGARVDNGSDQGLLISVTEAGFVADSPAVYAAKQLVRDNGFEVVKDSESDYFIWRARNWVEESGCFDTDDEAYLDCVKVNGLAEG